MQARLPVSGGEVVARVQGVGVVGAQHPLPVGQGLLNRVIASAVRPASR